MRYDPWLPPASRIDREFYQRFMSVGDAFHRGTLSGNELNQWYQAQFATIVPWVRERSTFYKQHLAGLRGDAVSLSRLTELPFTTKEDLRRAQANMVCGEVREAQFYYQTTGTTGASSPCPRQVAECLVGNFNVAQSLLGLLETLHPGGQPILGVMAPNEVHGTCNSMSDVCKDLGIMNVNVYPASPALGFRTCLRVLANLKIDAIVTTPGLMLTIARAGIGRRYDLQKDFGIKLILCLGELCTEAMARNLESIFGCKVLNFLYGCQEVHSIACAKPDGVMLPAVPNYLFEVIDVESGRSLGPSGQGELCLTMLTPGSKPLIRYRTGDLVDLAIDLRNPVPSRCQMQVLGRIKDRISLNGGSYAASELEQAVLTGVERCIGYQLKLREVDGQEMLHVSLEFLDRSTNAQGHSELRERVAARVRDRFGVPCEVEVASLDGVGGTGAWVSWKAARVVDERGRATREAAADVEDDAAREFAAMSQLYR